MGTLLAFRGLTLGIDAYSGFGKGINRIAVDRPNCFSIRTGRVTVYLTYAFVGEMISGDTGCYGA